MGKKKPEEMAQHREHFPRGRGEERSDARQKADEIFDLMEKFAGYGFNKSHAAAYALVAYQTAYLKAHHPAAFMAANMSLAMDDTDKVKLFYEDARAQRARNAAARHQRGRLRFRAARCEDDPLRPGRDQGHRRSGDRGHRRRARGGRPVQGSVRSSASASTSASSTAASIEALIRAGAFDAIDDHRARLLASVGIALDSAEQAERNAQQVSLFGGVEDAEHARSAARRRAALGRARVQLQRGKSRARLLLLRASLHGVPRRDRPVRALDARPADAESGYGNYGSGGRGIDPASSNRCASPIAEFAHGDR